ncbi:MAG: thiamine phosphate synthase [Planctomycetota bacterium]
MWPKPWRTKASTACTWARKTLAQVAREVLGSDPLIGLSTHNYREVRAADDLPVDYLGFGAVFATSTKEVLAATRTVPSWVASSHSRVPVFPIGGITELNAWQLAPVGRAAVASGILAQADPAHAAAAIRRALTQSGANRRRHF